MKEKIITSLMRMVDRKTGLSSSTIEKRKEISVYTKYIIRRRRGNVSIFFVLSPVSVSAAQPFFFYFYLIFFFSLRVRFRGLAASVTRTFSDRPAS